MKTILWVCNTPLPDVQGLFGIRNYNEGWLVGISNQLRKREDIAFHYAFLQTRYKRTISKTIDGVAFWGIYDGIRSSNKILKENIQHIHSLIQHIKPDIIHIFGTEFPHSLECIYGAPDISKIIVSIQGMPSELAKVYGKGITFKDRLAGEWECGRYHCLLLEQVNFYRLGLNEKRLLARVKNVIGRTAWDRQCVGKVNAQCRYHYCSETLRDVFYESSWDIGKIQRHSIFISQAKYPIKGLHLLIPALPLIKKRYPGTKVYVGGDKQFIENNQPYGVLVRKLMKRYDVEEDIIFLGFLTDDKVKERLLSAHVMLMPSLLENSPNSVGEAMLLGTPVVASNVGGIPSILEDGKEGYLYPVLDCSGLAARVCRIFNDDALAVRLSKNSRKRAKVLYDRTKNMECLLKIYDEI